MLNLIFKDFHEQFSTIIVCVFMTKKGVPWPIPLQWFNQTFFSHFTPTSYIFTATNQRQFGEKNICVFYKRKKKIMEKLAAGKYLKKMIERVHIF